jgi:hypothetical protein
MTTKCKAAPPFAKSFFQQRPRATENRRLPARIADGTRAQTAVK